MIRRVFHELRLVGELARKEALDVRAIALGVIVLVIGAVGIVYALWNIDISVMEQARWHFRLSLAVIATIPIVAECFGGEDRNGGARWVRPLPVSATSVFLARALVIAAFGGFVLAVAGLTDLIAVHIDSEYWRGRGPLLGNGRDVRELDAARRGASVLIVVAVAATAIVVRHSAVAVITGVAVLSWCVLAFRDGYAPEPDDALRMPLLWTRLVIVPLAGSVGAAVTCLLAAWCVFSLRGCRERSPARRGVAITMGMLAAATVTFAAADDPFLKDSDALWYGQDVQLAWADTSDDGESVVLSLCHPAAAQPRCTVWVVDIRTGERRRVLSPTTAKFGALNSLINVEIPHWDVEQQRVNALYGRWGSFGIHGWAQHNYQGRGGRNRASNATGRLAFDRASGVSERVPGREFLVDPTVPAWKSERIGPLVDGVERERWSKEGVKWTIDIVKRNGDVLSGDLASRFGGRPLHRLFYADPGGRVRHVDLDARTDVDTGLVLRMDERSVVPSPDGARWIVVQRADFTLHLFDRVEGIDRQLPFRSGFTWTHREDPLLIRTLEGADDRPAEWMLLGSDGFTPIHFDRFVEHVADLDGTRWMGFSRSPAAMYIFDADGRVLLDLSPGGGR